MDITSTAIPDVKLIRPPKHGDHRGFLSETYSARALGDAVGDAVFVQDNHSFSATRGTLRGLHFQIPPFAQAKLVRVIKGAIWDVAVDLRAGSATFGRHVGVELSADNWTQAFVPVGFAHGFCTLEPDTEVLYKVTSYYAPECERGVAWNDPDLRIAWPIAPHEAVLSDKDQTLPPLRAARDSLPF